MKLSGMDFGRSLPKNALGNALGGNEACASCPLRFAGLLDAGLTESSMRRLFKPDARKDPAFRSIVSASIWISSAAKYSVLPSVKCAGSDV
jgi:hypothetical protein